MTRIASKRAEILPHRADYLQSELDKGINEPHRVIGADVLVQTFGKKHQLLAGDTGHMSHLGLPPEGRLIIIPAHDSNSHFGMKVSQWLD